MNPHAKILTKAWELNSRTHWKKHTPQLSWFLLQMQGWFNIHKLINVVVRAKQEQESYTLQVNGKPKQENRTL